MAKTLDHFDLELAESTDLFCCSTSLMIFFIKFGKKNQVKVGRTHRNTNFVGKFKKNI